MRKRVIFLDETITKIQFPKEKKNLKFKQTKCFCTDTFLRISRGVHESTPQIATEEPEITLGLLQFDGMKDANDEEKSKNERRRRPHVN
jgi:hypothetical protein